LGVFIQKITVFTPTIFPVTLVYFNIVRGMSLVYLNFNFGVVGNMLKPLSGHSIIAPPPIINGVVSKYLRITPYVGRLKYSSKELEIILVIFISGGP